MMTKRKKYEAEPKTADEIARYQQEQKRRYEREQRRRARADIIVKEFKKRKHPHLNPKWDPAVGGGLGMNFVKMDPPIIPINRSGRVDFSNRKNGSNPPILVEVVTFVPSGRYMPHSSAREAARHARS